jgi:hypothetical protein
MTVHAIYPDFFLFLDRLAASREDPWELYERHYLGPHRAMLTAWWEQCLGLPVESWQARVRDIRPGEYGLLRTLVEQTPPEEIVARALHACDAAVGRLRRQPPPQVHLLVGFFSPDAFVFQVTGEWAIGVGLERFADWSRLPILVAHEYAHCLRRRLFPGPATLGERLLEEGLAAHFSQLVFPDRPLHCHLLMARGEYNSLLTYEPKLLSALRRFLDSTDQKVIQRFLFGRMKGQPARAGCFLGYRMAEEAMKERKLALPGALLVSSLVSRAGRGDSETQG